LAPPSDGLNIWNLPRGSLPELKSTFRPNYVDKIIYWGRILQTVPQAIPMKLFFEFNTNSTDGGEDVDNYG
jgi:hypothetical protein